MANKTLEQLYLEREHQKRETEGAPESTRVALSAASGRNILKTKEETAKLRRDEEIASAQVQAAIDKNSAAGAVTMAKAQNSADLQEEKRAFDMEKVRRNEAIAMMNMGIYDPSFAGLLRMDDSTIRRAADRKASEIAQAKAKRAAAEKAQADYEAALKNLQEQREKEVKSAEWYETKIDREIAAFEAKNKTVENAEEAKKKIVESADVEKVLIPWATPTEKLLSPTSITETIGMASAKLKSPDYATRTEAAQEMQERLRQAGEQLKREKEVAQQNKARAMAYYDEAITKKIKEKETAGEELSALESAFKSKMQDNFGALLTASKYDMENASTAEEQEQAYRAYGDFLYTGVADTLAKSDDLIELTLKKKNNAEQLTDDEQSAVEAQIEAVEQIAVILRNELKTMDFTIEQQDLIDDYLQRLEGSSEYLQAAKDYYVHYEENKEVLEYAAMDQKYGTLSAEEVLAQIEYLKSGKYDTSNERKQISKKGMARARAEALSNYEEKTKLNAEIDAEVARLERYLEKKNGELRSARQIESGRKILALTGGANLVEQFKLLIGSDGVVDDALGTRSRVTLKDYNPGGLFDAGSPEKRAEKRAFQEQKADGTMAYLSLLAPTMEEEFKKENLRPGAWLEAIKLNAFDLQKYNNGREETYRGNYPFGADVLRFKNGEYGIFTQEEALRTLAVYARYGPDVAFDYYATAREEALLREADKLNKWGAAGMGMVSGITRFATHGGYMLGNALEQGYARIGGDIMSASHQVTLENLDKMGMGGDILEGLYMSGYTVLDMVPAVALSAIPTVGQAAASGYIFAKTMANTYTDSIARGKRADEALTFSILSATSEVAMERIIGGISAIGSKNSLNAKLKVAIENLATTSRMKTVLKIAGSMGAEGFEEFLQEVVSPFLGKIAADLNGISDAELEEIDWEEAAKSFALGAITGGVFDGISGYSDYRRGNLRSVLSYNSLQDGSAVELINVAAEQGNKRAVQIKSAIQSNAPRYQGRDGLFAYASVHDMNNIRKSIKRRGNRAVQNAINAELDAAEGNAAHKEEIKRIFNKILNARSLTLHESAALINDPQGIKIFESMIGEDTSGLMPDEVAYLARLASFVDPNGKVSKARLDLFRDTFGELDYKALQEIIKYNDMVGMHVGGVLYENPSVEAGLNATEIEAVEAMKELSKETGTVYLVTDEHQTGTFLASNLLAVNRADLNQGVYYLLAHEAYFKTKQLDPELGAKIKDFLLEEIEQLIGADGIATEIKKIRQQEIVDGEMIDEDVAKDELCARMMPAVFLRGNYAAADRLAETNIEAATLLRKTLGAIHRNIENEIEQNRLDPKVLNYVASVLSMKDASKINKRKHKIEGIGAEHLVLLENAIENDIGIRMDLSDYEIWFLGDAVQHIEKRHGKYGEHDHTMSRTEDYALIPWVLKNAKNAGVLKNDNGEIIRDAKYLNSDGSAAIQVAVGLKMKGDVFYVVECVPDATAKRIYIKSAYKNSSENAQLLNMESVDSPQPTPEAPNGYYSATVNNSISNSSENVNGDFDRVLLGIHDRLTQILEKHRNIERVVGAGRGSSADFDGTSFSYADAKTKGNAHSLEYEGVRFDDMTEEQREAYYADRQADLDEYLNMVLDSVQIMGAEEKTDPAQLVSGEVNSKPSIFTKEGAKRTWNAWRRTWTDTGATVYDISREMKDPSLYHYYNTARSSTNSAIYMVLNKQVDTCGNEIGKGLNEIFNPIRAKGLDYYNEFQLYLLHLHNVDRMSRRSQQAIEQADEEFSAIVDAYPELKGKTDNEIRTLAKSGSGELAMMAQDYVAAMNNKEYWGSVENLPIFGFDVTAEDSRAEAENLLRKHPEFKELAKDVYQYSNNLLQYRVDSGLITKEFAEKLKQIYPHYVPTAREQADASISSSGISANQVRIGKTIKRAIGGDTHIVPLHKQFSDQTLAVVREGAKNRFGMRLLKLGDKVAQIKKIENISDRMIPIVTFDGQINMVDPFKTDEFQNIFTVYLNGEQYVMEVTPDLFDAVKALSPDKEETNILTKLGRESVDLYKKLITAYNPAFAVRNFARDMQDALFYTKDLRAFAANYLSAIREIKENGDLWKKYCALGGTYSSIFNFDTGTINEQNGFQKKMARIEGLNMMIEQLPRFAEFMATVKKGNGSMENLMEAMYNAADITTNFGRSGKWGKFLNRTFVPFFNPGVQGFSKAVRAFTETKGARPWMALILKAAFLGFAPALLNGILWGDDEEWKIINQREKDVNYLFKIGDNLWVKIPKGRALSVLGMSADRIKQVVQGEDVEWGEFFTTIGDQIAPANPLTANVAAAIMSIGYNKTWYGGDIVSQSMQNLPKAEQYDAQTDVVSIWVGKVLNQSPKKINYILDQYTGVVGDILLPAMSVANERGFFEKAFTIDTTYSNRLSGDFYDRLQELTERKNSVNSTAEDEVKFRWWNKKAGDLSVINKEIKAVQADSSLSRKEKEERLGVLYGSKNAFILAAEDEYDRYMQTVDEISATADLNDEEAADVIFREVNREMFGSEVAIQIYSKEAHARAIEVCNERGIDFDTYYDVYFNDAVSNEQTFDLIVGGLNVQDAMVISADIQALDPEEGEKSVSYLQKYRAIIESSVSDETKHVAMSVLATDADKRRVAIGADEDISIDLFVNIKEKIEYLNELDGKQSASNARIEAAIRNEEELTDRQRAVLWQLFTSSDSAKNNPFSVSVGVETLAKIERYKASEE